MRNILVIALFMATPLFAASNDFSGVEASLKQAMKSELRSEKEIKRDRNRMPIQTLEFFGLRSNMKVIELIPGGGWYTKLLAPVLAEKGDFSVAVGSSYVKKSMAGKKGFEKLKVIDTKANLRKEKGAKFYSLDKFSLKETNVDMVLTFRNYHNFGLEGRQEMNKAVFKALKTGGIYAVVDHTRRHMEGLNNENKRRFDPVQAIKEIQDAGFVLVDYSTLHYRADDELRYEVGRKSVTGNTDRFTLKFKKP